MSIGDSDAESDNLGKFCGDYPEAFVVTSITNRLRVEFVSDNSVEKTGFAAYFLTGSLVFLHPYQGHTAAVVTSSVCASG